MVDHGQSVEQVVAEAVEGWAVLGDRLRAMSDELGELEELVQAMRAEVEGGGDA